MSPRKSKERKRVKWSQTSLEKAFMLVANGQHIREAARATNVPFSTLQERLKKQNSEKPQLGRNTVFTTEQEEEMSSQIKYLAKIFYGCSSFQIKKMAYEYAENNNIKHNFNKTLKIAGKDWLRGFLRRNNLSVRKAEGTSLNRATAFNKKEVEVFYNLLEGLMDKYKFLPRNIYNADETGFSSVQDPGKIVAEKGQKRVGSITSGERGQNITAMCAMSATGVYIPPMFIFPRQRHSVALEKDGPRGALYKNSKNGWINEELFVDWLKHFAEFTKPSKEELILLILDNHSSHVSLKAYEFCKQNHIVMLSIPPHSSHRTQPLDVSFFGPFKAAYKQECNWFMKSNLGQKITPNDIASLFRKAFQNVATINKAEAGFAATGIYPLNPKVFPEEDFWAAELLNDSEPKVCEESQIRENVTPVPQTTESTVDYDNPVPSTSADSPLINHLNKSAKHLLPVPKKSAEAKKIRTSRRQHAVVITATPNKEVLVDKENKKLIRETKKKAGTKISKRGNIKAADVKRVRKKVLQDKNESSSESDVEMKDLHEDEDDIDIVQDNNANKCVICEDYGQDNELWYRCVSCGLWSHAECSGYDSAENYICDLCRNRT